MRVAERLLLPRKVAGVEVANLPLTPVEAFVLSQLDGATEIAEVAIVTNLDEREVRRVIQRLEELGAIETGTESQRNPRSRKALDPRRDEGGPTVIEEHFRPVAVLKPRAPAPAKAPPPEALPPAQPAEEDIDIDIDRRAQIDDLHARLDTLSHYQLLDVSPKAEKKAIKEAYFRIIPVFHPDKYFGKKVGSYKKKLERVFERLTQAYEVLTRAQKRLEYDTYLVTRRATRAFDAVLSSIPPPPPSEKPPVPTPIVANVDPSERTTLPVRAPSSIDPERRRRFADRILSSKPAAPEVPVQKLPPDQALDGLRRLLAPRREAKAAQQVERFRVAGERAFEDGKWVSAVNALRIALSLVPEDDRLRALLDEAENKAAAELAGSYQARASYEERNQNWEQAARSYQRVAAGRPKDHEPLDKAAQCLMRSSADPRQAVTLARQATQLAPKVVSCRLTLARAYEAADLINSAMAELERAREISPKDSEITDWIARLKGAKR